MIINHEARPLGIVLLSVFFLTVAITSFALSVSLIHSGSFLEPMWRFNPPAHERLMDLGERAVVLLFSVAILCTTTAIWLWRGLRWGHWLAFVLVGLNLLGDTVNALFRGHQGAIVGIPISLAILAYLLSKRVRLFFSRT